MKLKLYTVSLLFIAQLQAQKSDFNHINFEKADSIALAHKGEDLGNLPQLAFKLTNDLPTDIERYRAIYKWVCDNIANDYSLYLKNKRKRKRFKYDSLKFQSWNNTFRKTLFQDLLKKKRTICTGYAYLVKELAQLAELECEIVQGYGRVSTTDIDNLDLPNHSWNAVKLNDKWYLCDPTWASGIPDTETNQFTFDYNNGFFLANPELFSVNHFPIDAKWWLLDKDVPSFQTFLESPIIYGKAYENLETHIAPKQMHQTINRFTTIDFVYKTTKTIKSEDIKLLFDNGFSNSKTQPQYVSIKDRVVTLKHQFKTSGFFDVHLFIEDNLISTYTFKVK